MIDILLLGTGGMMPLPDRWLSSLLIRHNGELTLCDCGEGTQIPWRRFGWGFRRLSTICISHAHADHVAGLPGLFHSLSNAGRTEPVTLVGPPGIAAVVAGLRTIAPFLTYELTVTELIDGGAFRTPSGLAGHVRLGEHGLPCFAYRFNLARARAFSPERATARSIPIHLWRALQHGESVDWPGGRATPDDVLGPPRPGRSLAFVTDTRPRHEFIEFLTGVDLLICEGTYGSIDDLPKAIVHGHMTFAEAATLARDANARALWLTHFSPALSDPATHLDTAAAIFPATTIGYSGLTTSLRFDEEPTT